MRQARCAEITFDLDTEDRTCAFATALAPQLRNGDVLCLHGPIGAGKSVLARTIIRQRLMAVGQDEDIPSPTFTLVQCYSAGPLEIWHSDLYRLSDWHDIGELGLEDAFDSSLHLIEWPDRLGEAVPRRALHLTLAMGARPTERRLTVTSNDESWEARIASALAVAKVRPLDKVAHA